MSEKCDFAAADLIPEWWNLVGVETVGDIKFLGRVTIYQMVSSWRQVAKELGWQISRISREIEFLEDNNAESVRALAKAYEDPRFDPEQIGVPKDSWIGEPEPLDEASRERRSGATTYNVCGWCKYAMGTRHHHCCVAARCTFAADAGIGIYDVKRRFDTPCFLKNAGDEVFRRLVGGLARQREILVGRMQEIFAKIEFLLGLGERAERKPPLAGHRPYDWFRTGDPVVCYIGGLKRARISQRGWGENNLTFKEWFFGKVGECSCEGGLVFVNPSLGYGGWYSASRPEILHVWEYSYLCGHLGFAKVWMANVPPHLEDFDPDRMLAALNK